MDKITIIVQTGHPACANGAIAPLSIYCAFANMPGVMYEPGNAYGRDRLTVDEKDIDVVCELLEDVRLPYKFADNDEWTTKRKSFSRFLMEIRKNDFFLDGIVKDKLPAHIAKYGQTPEEKQWVRETDWNSLDSVRLSAMNALLIWPGEHKTREIQDELTAFKVSMHRSKMNRGG